MFKEASLSLPLVPVMIDFLRCFKLTTCQLSPTAVRTICEIEKLDQIHGTSLGIDELKY